MGSNSNESNRAPTFTGVEPTCPTCGTALELLDGEIVISGETDAHVPAYCTDEGCGWDGEAQYEMVDLI